MHKSMIIVAGGSGRRMGSKVPKQFLSLAGIPVLMRTLDIFNHFDASLDIIVVLPDRELGKWNDLCKKHDFGIDHRQVTGGKPVSSRYRMDLLSLKRVHSPVFTTGCARLFPLKPFSDALRWPKFTEMQYRQYNLTNR